MKFKNEISKKSDDVRQLTTWLDPECPPMQYIYMVCSVSINNILFIYKLL